MSAPYPRLALGMALLAIGSVAHAQATSVTTATTTPLELTNSDSVSVSAGGSITVPSKAISLKNATTGTGVVVDNSGTIQATTGRAIDSSGTATAARNYTFYNRTGGLIDGYDDALRINSNFPSGSIVINNAGTIHSSTGQAIDLDAVRGAGVTTTVINEIGGLIHGDASDGIKTGSNATITNHGEISTGDSLTDDDKFDGVDVDSATGVTIYNDGLISGGRHGITTDLGATLYNDAGGTVVGRNGSGFGSDGDGTVVNYGTITGAYSGLKANGDGDGVDIDDIGQIENHGLIQGTGAGGVDKNGFANGSEGIALGGGQITNYAGATISGANNGILVDDGSGGSGVGATHIENHGVIQGLDGFGINLVGNFNDSVINSGRISGSNGLALGLGDGDDSLTLQSGSQFVGLVDGGAGTDTLTFEGAAGGSFGASQNFERLLVNQGTWTLTGSGDFSNGGEIASGAELINQGGIAGNMLVDTGGVYAGAGTVGSLSVNGTLLATTGLGAPHVTGDLNMASGSTLAFGVNPDGTSAAVNVGGTANLNGATLAVQASNGSYPWQSRYTVLNAGSVKGAFGTVTSNYAFLTPTVDYSATQVELTFTRNDVTFDQFSTTANGARAARGLAGLSNDNPLYSALVSTSNATAGSAIESLAGSSNASLAGATLAASSQVGANMLATLRQFGSNGGLAMALDTRDTPLLASTGVPASARNLNDPNAQGRLWLQGLGSHGTLDGEHGSSAVKQDTQGGLLGADWAMGRDWRVGVLGGYSKTDLDSSGLDGNIDSWHVGAYALHQSGPVALRLGAAYSGHDGDSKRNVAFGSFDERLKGDYNADSQQAFAELGYQIGSGRISAEPFANLGYQRYHRDSYDEKGGSAALHVDAQTQDNVTSTLGLRVAQLSQLPNGMSLTPRGSLGWRHAYGDVQSSTRQNFLLGGNAFNVEGTALDRDSLLVEAGLDLGVSAHQTLGVGYSGDFGSDSRNHAVMGEWRMSF